MPPPSENPGKLDILKVVAEIAERGKIWNSEHPDSAEPPRIPEKSVPSSVPHTSGAAYRRISDVEATPLDWLWKGKFPRGKVAMIVGHPGGGKSTLALNIAAICSRGGCFPVDRTHAELGTVIILSAEDDCADTIRPRLEAAEADLKRCYILDAVIAFSSDGKETRRAFNLESDLDTLENLILKIGGVTLVIVDPISAYLGGADSHKNADVRALLAPLAELAAKHGVAVVAISHLSKSQAVDALLRISGSVAFAAAARAAFAVVRDPENHARRLFLPLKNNLASDESGLAFTVEGFRLPNGIDTSRILFEPDPVLTTADQALASKANPEHSASDEAVDWLRGALGAGPMLASAVQEEARQAGIHEGSLRRARAKLGIKPQKLKGQFASQWQWALPTHEDAEVAAYKNAATSASSPTSPGSDAEEVAEHADDAAAATSATSASSPPSPEDEGEVL